jgi:hypothetical protein
VKRAKDHVAELFADEGIGELGLEEAVFDEARNAWLITLGFTRPWDRRDVSRVLDGFATGRTYKVVTVDANGLPIAVRNREQVGAG